MMNAVTLDAGNNNPGKVVIYDTNFPTTSITEIKCHCISPNTELI